MRIEYGRKSPEWLADMPAGTHYIAVVDDEGTAVVADGSCFSADHAQRAAILAAEQVGCDVMCAECLRAPSACECLDEMVVGDDPPPAWMNNHE